MNGFVARRSTLFLFLAWALVAAMFADGANLDDLIPGAEVFHSDEDATTPDSFVSSSLQSDVSSVVNQIIRSEPVNNPGALPAPETRWVILDQDSPSLATDGVCHVDRNVACTPTTEQIPGQQESSTESLFLRLHTLLI
jgi:hypothetical protein